jgi:hypothetical protein
VREYASPYIANLIAARVPPEEFDRRARAPLSEAEVQEIAELVGWFTRKYPTAKERLAYARRKMRQYKAAATAEEQSADYLETARRLSRAHRTADPGTELVFLVSDPDEKEIRLLEVTRSEPTTFRPFEVSFAARPDLGVPFPLTILLLSPEEWDAVKDGRLELPGWSAIQLRAIDDRDVRG